MAMESSQTNKKAKKHDDIPVDVLINILSRVPGSSLLRFRCVCKLWCSLMCDPYLIDLHLQNSPKSNLPCIIFNRHREDGGIHLTLLDQAGVPMPSLTLNLDRSTRMTNPCNGLVGFYDNFTIRLFNLTTRKFRTPWIVKPRRSFCRPRCFLGYHPATKEHKVLRLVDNSQKTHDYACEVFTFGTGLWRQIGNFNCELFRHSICVSGAIYWQGWRSSTRGSGTIVSFDLKEDKFILISLPSSKSYSSGDFESQSLFEEEGRVCLVAFPFGSSIDIWMLSVGETKHAWSHKYHVKHNIFVRWPFSSVIFIQKGKLLIHSDGRLFYCDLRSRSLSCQEVYTIKKVECAPFHYKDIVHVYVESLESLRNIQGTHVHLGS